MKKKILVTLLTGGLILLASCNKSDYDLEKMIPEEFHKIVYLKTYGKQELNLLVTGKKNVFNYSVLKGGVMPELTATADLKVMTQKELDEKYSNLENVKYKLITEEAYTISNTHFDFTSEENYKEFNISFDPQIVADDSEDDPDAVWVLPLYLSSDTDSVNANKNNIFLQVTDIVRPLVGFKTTVLEYREESLGSPLQSISLSVPVVLNVENTGWNIDCSFATNADYVKSYNETHGTSFQLLESGYSFDESLTLSQTTPEASINVKVDIKDLGPGDYLLPIEIVGTSIFGIQNGKNIYPLAIRIMGYIQNRDKWEAKASSDSKGAEMEGDYQGGAEHAIDGNVNTFWNSRWKNPIPNPPHYLWFDTKRETLFTHIRIVPRDVFKNEMSGKFYVSDSDVAISSDDSSWKEVGSFTMLDTPITQIFGIVPTKGRQIMIKVESSTDGNKTACFAEVYAYGM